MISKFEEAKSLIVEISKDLSLKVIFVDMGDNTFDDMTNRSSCTFDCIWIGWYDDAELMLISFFHELGHILIDRNFIEMSKHNTLLIELECWNIGFKEAMKRGIFFSDEAIQWGIKQGLSYSGHDERECCNWESTTKKTLWINKNDQNN